MFCEFCHYSDPPTCNCYILQNSDSLTCTQCNRVQSDFFGESVQNLKEELQFNEKKSFFLEISQKLCVSDFVGQLAFQTFENLKKNIRKSTKRNNVLIAFCFKKAFSDFDIFFPTDRIFKMLDVEICNFVKVQRYFYNKNIRINISKCRNIEADNIFLCLDVFCPEMRKVLSDQAVKILETTDYKLETICCAVYMVMMLSKMTTRCKTRIFLRTCRERIGVTKNSIKKIIFRFYGLKI